MIAAQSEEVRISLPDVLAVARIVAVPGIMALTVAHRYVPAVILFAVAAATDWFDGYFARRWGITTIMGAFLDTTADKLLVTGSLLALISVGRASIWVALIIILREFVVMALRGLAAIGGSMVKPSIWGKLKAGTQFFAIGLALLRPEVVWGPLYLDEWAMWGAAAITTLSGWEYVSRFWVLVRSVDRGEPVVAEEPADPRRRDP